MSVYTHSCAQSFICACSHPFAFGSACGRLDWLDKRVGLHKSPFLAPWIQWGAWKAVFLHAHPQIQELNNSDKMLQAGKIWGTFPSSSLVGQSHSTVRIIPWISSEMCSRSPPGMYSHCLAVQGANVSWVPLAWWWGIGNGMGQCPSLLGSGELWHRGDRAPGGAFRVWVCVQCDSCNGKWQWCHLGPLVSPTRCRHPKLWGRWDVKTERSLWNKAPC